MKNCVLVLNYNSYKETKLFVEKIEQYNCIDFIVVVDNNSSDNSFKNLKKCESEKIHVINSGKNGGYSYGNNYGFNYLKELLNFDFNLVVSNPDVEIEEEALKKLFNCINNSNVGIVGPVIVEGDRLNRGWKVPKIYQDILLNIPFVNKLFFKNILSYSNYKYQGNLTKVESVSGSIFGMRAEVLSQVGMFDEHVFLYYEENILAKKLEEINKDVCVLNDVRAIHHHSVTIDKNYSSYKKLKVLKESQLYFHQNYSKTNRVALRILKCSTILLLKLYKIRYGDDSSE